MHIHTPTCTYPHTHTHMYISTYTHMYIPIYTHPQHSLVPSVYWVPPAEQGSRGTKDEVGYGDT